MVKLMVESIELHAGNDPDWLNRSGMERRKEEAYELASKLLRDMTDAGMIPPLTKALPYDFTNTGFTQDFLDEHEFKVNRWEPEDD